MLSSALMLEFCFLTPAEAQKFSKRYLSQWGAISRTKKHNLVVGKYKIQKIEKRKKSEEIAV